MSSLYQKTAQVLVNWSGEDAACRTPAAEVGRQIVDMLMQEIRDNGMPDPTTQQPIESLKGLLDGQTMRCAG